MTANEIGDAVADAFGRRFGKYVVPVLWLALLLQLAWVVVPIGRDSTDGARRSGLAVLTDCLTGRQYLSASGGGVTPRLDSAGVQIVEPCQ